MQSDALERTSSNGDYDNGGFTENSPLLQPSEAGESVNSESQLWDELNKPWPSTFERSVSLLASPILPKRDVEIFTKSPKPGASPMAMARKSDLDRGYYTPTSIRGVTDGGVAPQFEARVPKTHSLDFSKSTEFLKAIDAVTEQQQSKAIKAKEYRQQILKKQQDPTNGKARQKSHDHGHGGPRDGKSTFKQCIFNLVNILMGVGLLGLPYVFKSGGWVGGSLCLFIFCLCSWRTAILISRELNGDPRPCHYFQDSPFKSPHLPGSAPHARMRPPLRSFPDLARESFGRTGNIVVSIILYFELFSCVCVLMVAMGDHLHKVFPSVSFNMHTTIVSAISLLPTVVLKTPALLSYLSMVGTISTVVLVVAVVASYLIEGDITSEISKRQGIVGSGPYHIAWNSEGLALALGMVGYCFSGHAIVPAIFTTMEKPHEFESMVSLTFIIVTISCFAVAISGYVMFGQLVEEEVTLSLKESGKAELAMEALTWLMILTGMYILHTMNYIQFLRNFFPPLLAKALLLTDDSLC